MRNNVDRFNPVPKLSKPRLFFEIFFLANRFFINSISAEKDRMKSDVLCGVKLAILSCVDENS